MKVWLSRAGLVRIDADAKAAGTSRSEWLRRLIAREYGEAKADIAKLTVTVPPLAQVFPALPRRSDEQCPDGYSPIGKSDLRCARCKRYAKEHL